MKKKTKLTPSLLLYYSLMPLLLLYCKVRLKIKFKKPAVNLKKDTYLILANHVCPVDFLIYTLMFFPKKINYVVAENMANRRLYRWFINHYRTIKRHQFSNDFASIKSIKGNLDKGVNVLLMPEGKVTIDGRTGYIPPSIAKLVKWLKYPVVLVKTQGAYLANPKWNEQTYYRSPVKVDATCVLSPETIEKMSNEELLAKIHSVLDNNDQQYRRDENVVILKQTAEGLENLLYKCPVCGAEGHFSAVGNKITCSECNTVFTYTPDGTINSSTDKPDIPVYVDEWVDLEREDCRRTVSDDNFLITADVDIHMVNDKTNYFEKQGEGLLQLNSSSLVYKGSALGRPFEIKFDTDKMATVALVLGHNFEIFNGKIYRFVFEKLKLSTKFALCIEECYKLKHCNCN